MAGARHEGNGPEDFELEGTLDGGVGGGFGGEASAEAGVGED